jgi:transposase
VKDTELYAQILGIGSPFSVARVELLASKGNVSIWVEHEGGARFDCPECGASCTVYDHAEERTWRHLDTCQLQTLLHARIPRVNCPEHGVRQARVPWAEPKSRFTLLFERFAIDVMLETDGTGAGKILGLSWDEVQHLKERAVARGRARKPHVIPKHLGLDEKSIAKGQKYLTITCDQTRGTVEHLADGRTQDSAAIYFSIFTETELSGIESVAMDMWPAYFQIVSWAVPDAEGKIVFDPFHVVGHANKAVDQVRRRENRELSADGDRTLVGSKYLWLYGKENVPRRRRLEFAAIKRVDLKTGRAWAMKEMLRRLWRCKDRDAAQRLYEKWYAWVMRSRMAPMIRVAKMVQSHLPNILTYYTHRVTNAVSEGINSAIQTIKKRAFGFRNPDNFKTAIYFHCGGLDLYPEPQVTHAIPG